VYQKPSKLKIGISEVLGF